MKEVFRTIDGFNGRYKVSNYGNVYSSYKKNLLKQFKPSEYSELYVTLSSEGYHKMYQVAKLVLLYFRPSQIPKASALHLDTNLDNNLSNNLEWGTRGDKRRQIQRLKNKPRGVYSFLPNKNGTPTYRAALKVGQKVYSLGYSKDKSKCELLYLTSYLAAYGVLPYVD